MTSHALTREAIVGSAQSSLDALLRLTDANPGVGLGRAYFDRNTTDVLAHLHAWHLLFETWVATERAGRPVSFPAEGYTWENLAALNFAIYEGHAGKPYSDLRALLVASHERMIALVESMDDDDLASATAHDWSAGEPVGSVAHECLGAHYDWGVKVCTEAGLK